MRLLQNDFIFTVYIIIMSTLLEHPATMKLLKHRRAAQILTNLVSSKLLVDYRLVRRFRIWQLKYLHSILKLVYDRHRLNLKEYKKSTFTYLELFIKKQMRSAFIRWKRRTQESMNLCLSNFKVEAAIKICAVLMKAAGPLRANFPMHYDRNRYLTSLLRERMFRVWKNNTINYLLYEHNTEKAVLSITNVVSNKITPLLLNALYKLKHKEGHQTGLLTISYIIKSKINVMKYYAFNRIMKKQTIQPKPWKSKERLAKLQQLSKVSGVHCLNEVINRGPPTFILSKFWAMNKWKKCVPSDELSISAFSFSPAPINKLKELAAMHLATNFKKQSYTALQKVVYKWRMSCLKSKPSKPKFQIDKGIISNQAHIAVSLESQITVRTNEVSKILKRIKILKLNFIFLKGVRYSMRKWIGSIPKPVKRDAERDMVFEYIKYLEEVLGLEHKYL